MNISDVEQKSPSASATKRGRSAGPASQCRPPSIDQVEQRHYENALSKPESRDALHQYKCALAKRDSVSRKLCGGSDAVTVEDLAFCENALSGASEQLLQLANSNFILKRHPVIASLIGGN